MVLPIFITDKNSVAMPMYDGFKSDLLSLPLKSFSKENIEGLKISNLSVEYIFKHVIDEKIIKKIRVTSNFVPEMAIFSC